MSFNFGEIITENTVDTQKTKPFSIEKIVEKDEVVIYVRIIDQNLLYIVKNFARCEELHSIKPRVGDE